MNTMLTQCSHHLQTKNGGAIRIILAYIFSLLLFHQYSVAFCTTLLLSSKLESYIIIELCDASKPPTPSTVNTHHLHIKDLQLPEVSRIAFREQMENGLDLS